MSRVRNLPPTLSAYILLPKRKTGKVIEINRLSSEISSRR